MRRLIFSASLLSGGQRQRLGIARALVRNSKILIMNEPSSGLDSESEHLVFDGLRNLKHGRTTWPQILPARFSLCRCPPRGPLEDSTAARLVQEQLGPNTRRWARLN